MQFLSVNYSLNKTYSVERQVFLDSVKYVVESCINGELISHDVKITTNKNVLIKVSIKPVRDGSISELFGTLSKSINQKMVQLIEKKAENIQIVIGDK